MAAPVTTADGRRIAYAIDDKFPALAWRTIANTIQAAGGNYTHQELVQLVRMRRNAGELPAGLDRLGADALVLTMAAYIGRETDTRRMMKRISSIVRPGRPARLVKQFSALLRQWDEHEGADLIERDPRRFAERFSLGNLQVTAYNATRGCWIEAMIHEGL